MSKSRVTAGRAFSVIFARIRWLQSKIKDSKLRGISPNGHYLEEIQALFWFAERVVEQARRLAERRDMPVDALVAALRQKEAITALKSEIEMEEM